MRRLRQILSVALLQRPWIVSLLLLFYLVGLLVAGGPVPEETLWFGLAILFAFPTAGIVGIVSERAGMLCDSAGALAIPGHAESIRRFQVLTLAIVVGLPIALAAWSGENVLAPATILCFAAAVGARPGLFVLFIVGAMLQEYVIDWLANAYVQAALLALALYVLVQWLRLPSKVEAVAAASVRTLADARHEIDTETSDGRDVFDPDEAERYEAALETAIGAHGYRPGYPATAADLGFAFGFNALVHWPAKLKWTAAACAVVVAVFFLRGQSAALGAYGIVMLFAIGSAFSRAASLYNAWRSTQGEQSLLSLAPSWPLADRLKPALAKIAMTSLPGAWLVWLATTALSLAVGAMDLALFMASAAAMAAVSTAILGNLLLALSRPKRSDWRLSTLFTIGAPAVGALGIALGDLGTPVSVAFVLIALPLVVGAVFFRRRPLPFPINLAR